MKKIFVLLLALTFVFSSCFMSNGSRKHGVVEESIVKDGIEFNSNAGIIMPLLPADKASVIDSRYITIADGEVGKKAFTETFHIKKGGTFYYPIVVENLRKEDLPDTGGVPYELIVGEKILPLVPDRKQQLLNFTGDEISLPDDKKFTVFEFINKVGSEKLEGPAPAMAVNVHGDYASHMYSFGFEGGTFTPNMTILDTFIPDYNLVPNDRYKDLLVFDGDYPDDFHIKGYENGALEKKIDGLDVEVKKGEINMYELGLMLFTNSTEGVDDLIVSKEEPEKRLQVMGQTFDMLANGRSGDAWGRRLDETVMNDVRGDRLFFLKFELEDDSALEIKKDARCSFNFCHGGKDDDVMEYYLLGSDIENTTLELKTKDRVLGVLVDNKVLKDDKNIDKAIENRIFDCGKNSDYEIVFTDK